MIYRVKSVKELKAMGYIINNRNIESSEGYWGNFPVEYCNKIGKLKSHTVNRYGYELEIKNPKSLYLFAKYQLVQLDSKLAKILYDS